MKRILFMFVLGGCGAMVKVEPVKVEPIHVKIDVNVHDTDTREVKKTPKEAERPKDKESTTSLKE
jgi:hypothetical protein